MANAASSLPLTGTRANGPQSSQLAFKPCQRFFGLYSPGHGFKKLCHQTVGAVPLALEVCALADCSCFKPRNLRPQSLNLCLEWACAFVMSTWRPRGVPYLAEINAHHHFAIV
jgi:hypothetical protein